MAPHASSNNHCPITFFESIKSFSSRQKPYMCTQHDHTKGSGNSVTSLPAAQKNTWHGGEGQEASSLWKKRSGTSTQPNNQTGKSVSRCLWRCPNVHDEFKTLWQLMSNSKNPVSLICHFCNSCCLLKTFLHPKEPNIFLCLSNFKTNFTHCMRFQLRGRFC